MTLNSEKIHNFFEELKIEGDKRYSPYMILRNKTNKAYISKQFELLFTKRTYKKVLDVGCGTAFYYPLISNKVNKIYGIDFSNNMLKHAKKFCKINHINNSKFYLGNAEELPFDNDEFDIVFCFDFLHHAINTDRVIKEMFRVVKRGGIVAAIETNPLNPLMLFFNLFYSPIEHGILKTFPFMVKKKFTQHTKEGVEVKYNRYIFPLFSATPDLGRKSLSLLNNIEAIINKLPLIKLFSTYYIVYAKKV